MIQINIGKGEAERTPIHATPGVGSTMKLNLAAENYLISYQPDI